MRLARQIMLPCCSVDIRLVRWLLKKAAYGFTIESKFKRIPVRIPAWFLRLRVLRDMLGEAEASCNAPGRQGGVRDKRRRKSGPEKRKGQAEDEERGILRKTRLKD